MRRWLADRAGAVIRIVSVNHRAALGRFFAHYNWGRKHWALKGETPAMAHGLATEVWSLGKMLETVLAA